MITYNRDELLAELATNLTVVPDGYGTWKVKSFVGRSRDPRAEDSYITHNESDVIGEFDGKTYNPQDPGEMLELFQEDTGLQDAYYDLWYDNYDWGDAGWGDDAPDADSAEAHDTYTRWVQSVGKYDPLFGKIYAEVCNSVWSDSANRDNYEPDDDRILRLAEKFIDTWEEGYFPDDVILEGDNYCIFESDSEREGLHLVQGVDTFTDFTDDFTEDELNGIYDHFSDDGWRRKLAGLLFSDVDSEIAENPNLLKEIGDSSYIGNITDLVYNHSIPLRIFLS